MSTHSSFIVLDGLDGSGKGTQIDRLKKRVSQEGFRACFTREPGGEPYAEKIRDVIMSKAGMRADPRTHFLLFWAARNEHMLKRIIPTRASGTTMFSDRFDSSTFAFQLYGEECLYLRDEFFRQRSDVIGDDGPSLYIIFDLPPEVAFERMHGDQLRTRSHFDERPIEYHARVRDGFREFAKHFPVTIMNADRTEDEIHSDVWDAVLPLLR